VVRGNHDAQGGPDNERGTTRFLAQLLGVPVVEEYELAVGGARYLVVHGDRFDGTMNLTWLGDVADWAYRGVQRLSRPAAHFLKAASKHVCGVVGSVRRGALACARERGFAGIITGHTHFCHDDWEGDLHLLDTGCWVDWPCSYVRVEQGEARLAHWEPGRASLRRSPDRLPATLLCPGRHG
jgi:UDP-2,3-diacylglucosamine pyrophosphatase LpxH